MPTCTYVEERDREYQLLASPISTCKCFLRRLFICFHWYSLCFHGNTWVWLRLMCYFFYCYCFAKITTSLGPTSVTATLEWSLLLSVEQQHDVQELAGDSLAPCHEKLHWPTSSALTSFKRTAAGLSRLFSDHLATLISVLYAS